MGSFCGSEGVFDVPGTKQTRLWLCKNFFMYLYVKLYPGLSSYHILCWIFPSCSLFSNHSCGYLGCSGWPYCHTLYIHLWVLGYGSELPEGCLTLAVRCLSEYGKDTHFPPSSFSFWPCRLRIYIYIYVCECLAALACFKPPSCMPSSFLQARPIFHGFASIMHDALLSR